MSLAASGDGTPSEQGKVEALQEARSILTDAFTSLPHGALSGTRMQKMIDASVVAHSIVMSVVAQLRGLGICGSPTSVFERNMATVRDPITIRLAVLLQTYIADAKVREGVMNIVSSLQPWTGKFVASLRAGGRTSELKLFADAVLQTFIMSKSQVRYFLTEVGGEVLEEPGEKRQKPVIVLATKRSQPGEAAETVPVPLEAPKSPTTDFSSDVGKANRILSVLMTSKSVPRGEKDCNKIAKLLAGLKAASAPDGAVAEMTEILHKAEEYVAELKRAPRPVAASAAPSKSEVDALLLEFSELRREFVDDPSYSSKVIQSEDVHSSREQLMAVKVTKLLADVSTRFAKELTKDEMTTVLSIACDMLNAVGNTLERSGIPDICAQLRTAALKCASLLPDTYGCMNLSFVPPEQASFSERKDRPVVPAVARDVTAPECGALSAGIMAMFLELDPTREEQARWQLALETVSKYVRHRLEMFGSAHSLFAIRGTSDIDLCWVDPTLKDSKMKTIIHTAGSRLRTVPLDIISDIQVIAHARVPIVKGRVILSDPHSPRAGVDFDMCVNNVLALHNTDLLRTYAQLDERVRPLAFLVKHWAKRREINVARDGTLSSYAYVNLALFFLQYRGVIPNLQDEDGLSRLAPGIVFQRFKVENHWVVYTNDLPKLRSAVLPNFASTLTIGQLLGEFFLFFGREYQPEHHTVSIRCGKLLNKKDVYPKSREESMSIEDPFELTHDLGQVVSPKGAVKLRQEFTRAADLVEAFKDGEVSAADWFSEMFQQSNEALPHRWHRKPRVCFTCNQGGHLARDCPKQREEDRARKLSAFSGSSRGERSAHRGGLRGGGRGGFSGGVSVVLANSK